MSNDSIVESVLMVVVGGFISLILLRYIGGTMDLLLIEFQKAGLHDYTLYQQFDLSGLLYLACWMPVIMTSMYAVLNIRRKSQQTPPSYEPNYYYEE